MSVDETVEAARRLLVEAETEVVAKVRPRTTTDRILELRKDIERLRARGTPWVRISEILRPVLVAGPDTIRLAIAGAPQKKKKSRKPRAKRVLAAVVTTSANAAAVEPLPVVMASKFLKMRTEL